MFLRNRVIRGADPDVVREPLPQRIQALRVTFSDPPARVKFCAKLRCICFLASGFGKSIKSSRPVPSKLESDSDNIY